MRGPLMSGPLGSPAALARVCALLRERPPTVVLSALWLASTIARELPVTLLIEPDRRAGALRALRRASAAGGRLMVAMAGEALPLPWGGIGSLVVEDVLAVEEAGEATEFLADLVPLLRPGGLLLSLEATKNEEREARLSGLFLAASLTGIAQERPREGAVLTLGSAPPREVTAARARPE